MKTIYFFLFTFFLSLILFQCASKKQAPTVTKITTQQADEPSFVIDTFGVLKKATTKVSLPYLADNLGNPLEKPCFEIVAKPVSWETKNKDIQKAFIQNKEAIDQSIHKELVEIFSKDISKNEMKNWTIEYEEPFIVHIPVSDINFVENMKCVGNKSKNFPLNSKIVTTYFGAKVIHIKSPKIVKAKTVRKLKATAIKNNLRIKPMDAFSRALDEKGKPKFDHKRRKLFNSPSGKLIFRKDIPLPKKRPMLEWSIKAKNPIYFAFGDLLKNAFVKETIKEKCSVYLVFDDVVPQVPECKEFNNAGFSIIRTKEDGVMEITGHAGDVQSSRKIKFNKTSMLQVGGSIITWLTLKEIEEGAFVEIDSFQKKSDDKDESSKKTPKNSVKK